MWKTWMLFYLIILHSASEGENDRGHCQRVEVFSLMTFTVPCILFFFSVHV